MEKYGEKQSDLALESASRECTIAGTETEERHVGPVKVTRFRVITREASTRLSLPCGTYVTLESRRVESLEAGERQILERLLAGELGGMASRLCQKKRSELSVLVAGLGNAELTADALGPATVAEITVTRHWCDSGSEVLSRLSCAQISAIAPGVTGQTGIETVEILLGIVERTAPDLVIVIDSLAARSCRRLAATVQISDVGLSPGSGVGNHRRAIDRKSLGVPVIAVGIPTVVDSATLVRDALASAGIHEIDPSLRRVLEEGGSLWVSPKESDEVCREAATLLARGIDLAFVEALSE